MATQISADPRTLVGQMGESLACEALRQAGYAILERNFRVPEGEIDLVTRDPGGVLVFVEVRTTSSLEFGHPLESIGREKKTQLRRVAARFLAARKVRAVGLRFDAVGVVLGEGEEPQIEIVRNALPGGLDFDRAY